jgi:cell division transport system permease protein
MSLKNWATNHTRAFLSSLGETVRTPFVNLLTFLVIGIAMTLPAGLFIVLQNVRMLDQQWHHTPTISLYLKQNLSDQALQTLQKDLLANPSINKIHYISPEQGLNDLSQQQSLGDTQSLLKQNPLPGVMIITPHANETPQQLQQLLDSLNQLPLVDVSQLNMTWVKRLYNIIQIGSDLTEILTVLFALGVILIIANTIRLTMHNKRAEINVMKLMGAKSSFIRRPLLYRGFLSGLFGGVIAWLLVYLTLARLTKPANALAQSYDTNLFVHTVSIQQGLIIVVLCAFLGVIGAAVTTFWQLYKHEEA